jgi:hypothetical protein
VQILVSLLLMMPVQVQVQVQVQACPDSPSYSCLPALDSHPLLRALGMPESRETEVTDTERGMLTVSWDLQFYDGDIPQM